MDSVLWGVHVVLPEFLDFSHLLGLDHLYSGKRTVWTVFGPSTREVRRVCWVVQNQPLSLAPDGSGFLGVSDSSSDSGFELGISASF